MLSSFTISKKKLTWRIFFFFMFILFLQSMYTYFFWSVSPIIVPGILMVFCAFFLMLNLNYFTFTGQNIIPFLLFIITLLYTLRDQNLNGKIVGILPFISLFLFFILKTSYKAKFLEALTKTLAVILIVSLIVWILVQLGVNLPKTEVSYFQGDELFTLDCYYAFVEYPLTSRNFFQRFMSIFVEPGYLASLLAILIYINNFQLKRKEILILFIALIFTFSLAGYFMLAVAYFSFIFKKKKNVIGYFVLFMIILAVSYNLALKLNNGDNMLNELVLLRLEVNDNGNISGYNRTDEEMDQMFIDVLNSSDVLTGMGKRYEHFGANVGIKPYTIINGLIGLFLLLLSYISGWLFNRRLFSLTISILYMMIFYKGHHEIFWAGYLMVYATAMYMPENWRDIYILEEEIES